MNGQKEPDAGGRVLQLAPKLAERQAERQAGKAARRAEIERLFAQMSEEMRQEWLRLAAERVLRTRGPAVLAAALTGCDSP